MLHRDGDASGQQDGFAKNIPRKIIEDYRYIRLAARRKEPPQCFGILWPGKEPGCEGEARLYEARKAPCFGLHRAWEMGYV